ncbi:site-specific integrase [Thermoleophilia bacterium SCSIO 60948]|nr:site-specific integrase [Thermoleophilia bacterium SCSIO 60948]
MNRRLGPVWTERGRPPEGYFTKRTAEAALQALLTDARRGELAGPDPVGASRTYAHACEEFLRYTEQDRDRSASTVRDYRYCIERRLYPAFGADTPLSSITTQRIDEARERMLAEGAISRRSVQKVLVVNYSILKRAKRKGWIKTNPAEDAERVTVKRSGDFNVLSPEEVAQVSRVADNEQDAALWVVAAFTGLRMGELRALRWGDIDFAGRTVFVRSSYSKERRVHEPKSGKVRSVPLIDQAAVELDRLSRRQHFTASTDLVFASPTGRHLDDKEMRMRFYSALDRAGLGHKRTGDRPLRFHDLRHTFGTLAAQVWPLVDVQAYMGHSSVTTTMIYAHHIPKRAAADALTHLVDGGNYASSHRLVAC